MREAVIVSTARTGRAKSVRGSFNNAHPIVLGGHALQHAIARAGVDPAEIDDVILGSGMPEGATGFNITRNVAVKAGCPVSTSGLTINRYCSSGLQAISIGAGRTISEGVDVLAAGGLESISMVQLSGKMNMHQATEAGLLKTKPALWMQMIETAEIVAARYGISREAQDAYAYQSQQRTAAGQAAGRFDAEIVPLAVQWAQADKATGETKLVDMTVSRDECNRADTTLASLAALSPVFKGGMTIKAGTTITAGNASQQSDGASLSILVERAEAERRGLKPLGVFRGFAVAGCEPDEMGIGPVYAVPKLLKKSRPEGGRHRPVGIERSLCFAVPVQPRQTGHRPRQVQRQRGRPFHWPPLRHDGRTLGRPCADRRQAPGCEVRGGNHVRGRRHGRCWPVRSVLSGMLRALRKGPRP